MVLSLLILRGAPGDGLPPELSLNTAIYSAAALRFFCKVRTGEGIRVKGFVCAFSLTKNVIAVVLPQECGS